MRTHITLQIYTGRGFIKGVTALVSYGLVSLLTVKRKQNETHCGKKRRMLFASVLFFLSLSVFGVVVDLASIRRFG